MWSKPAVSAGISIVYETLSESSTALREALQFLEVDSPPEDSEDHTTRLYHSCCAELTRLRICADVN